MILSMGFGDIAEIKTALRISKGDVNEAVSYLMDQPNPGGGYNMDIGNKKKAGKNIYLTLFKCRAPTYIQIF